jgi:hypothetical protein
MVERAKRIRLIESTFRDRDKIIWLTGAINEQLKVIKEEHKLASMEDVIVYLLNLYKLSK